MNVEQFTFYSMEEWTPPKYVPVLVKFTEYARVRMNMPNYYVCYYVPASNDNAAYFCEARGDEYWKYDPETIAGWARIDQI